VSVNEAELEAAIAKIEKLPVTEQQAAIAELLGEIEAMLSVDN
jgi:hypothetical protein